jgi:hypothetical protein
LRSHALSTMILPHHHARHRMSCRASKARV